jgi:hypothetical protein
VRGRALVEDAVDFDLAAWRARQQAAGAGGGGPWAAALDAGALGPRAVLRAVERADRFRPLGLEGEVSVADHLSRHGAPAWVRRGIRVLEAADGRIAWVVGHRVDARFAVTPSARRVARVEVEPLPASSSEPPGPAPP